MGLSVAVFAAAGVEHRAFHLCFQQQRLHGSPMAAPWQPLEPLN